VPSVEVKTWAMKGDSYGDKGFKRTESCICQWGTGEGDEQVIPVTNY